MGVDAKLLIKVPSPNHHLTPPKLLALSYELASTIGAEHFMIDNRAEVFGGGPREHAITIIQPWQEEDNYPEDQGKVVFRQDGDPIYAQPGEQFLEVHLRTRYWEPDYARGNWPIIRITIAWWHLHYPTWETWYGGDSSGFCAEHFTPAKLAEFDQIFLTSGRRPYTRHPNPFDRHPAPTCPLCQVPAFSCGGGGGNTFWQCDGCDMTAITRGQTAWWFEATDQISFAANAMVNRGQADSTKINSVPRGLLP